MKYMNVCVFSVAMLLGDLDTELARVRREVTTIFNQVRGQRFYLPLCYRRVDR